MGTTREWLSVLVWGGLWGAMMGGWTALRQDKTLPRRVRILNVALYAPLAVWFGIVATFGWRAWHRPLLFITVGLLLGMFLVGWVFRTKRATDT